jgi:hypothetical protein
VKRTLSNLGGLYWRTNHLRTTLTMDHTGLVYYATLTIITAGQLSAYLDKVREQLEKITRDTNGDVTISNPAFITDLLAANGLNDCNPSPTPHIDG